MSEWTRTCATCGSEYEWPENCKTCDKRRWDEMKGAQTERANALLSLGFSAPFTAGGMLGMEFASCLTCGAAVALTLPVEGQTHPLDAHKAWHDQHHP